MFEAEFSEHCVKKKMALRIMCGSGSEDLEDVDAALHRGQSHSEQTGRVSHAIL